MRIRTTRFGVLEEIDVPEQDVIDFPNGIVGFEAHGRFALLGGPELSPFSVLQSLVDPWTAFITVDLATLSRVDPPALAAARDVHAGEGETLCLGIVTLHERPEDATVNALAPVVIGRNARSGQQVILHDSGAAVAERLFAADENTAGKKAG